MALGLTPQEIVDNKQYPLLSKAEDWKRILVSDVATVQNGYAFKSSLFDRDEGVPLIRIRDITKPITEHKYKGYYDPDYIVSKGDILIGMDGDFTASRWKGPDALLNQRVCRIKLFNEEFDEKFLFICLQPYLNAIHAETSSVTVKHLSSRTISQIPLPFPSIQAQKDIVAKIETLFSELDKGIESLKTARQQLKTYRQAVLKHAFEGKLTAQWREQNKDKLESPEQLLTRIQKEREQRYQKQFEEWKQAIKVWDANGKEGKKPSKPKRLEAQKIRGDIDQSALSVPKEWAWRPIGEYFSVFVGATPSRKQPAYWGGNISWVSSGEVAFCDIKNTKEKITESGYTNASTEIHPPGTVMLAMIGEGKTRGQSAILRVSAAHNQNTAAIRVSEVGLVPEYIYYFFYYQYEVTRRVGSGNNQKALNKQRVSDMGFPVCGIEEQKEILDELESKLSQAEAIENEIGVQIYRAETLRQSILKKAFSGQLTTNNKLR